MTFIISNFFDPKQFWKNTTLDFLMLAEPAYISGKQWKWPIFVSLLLRIFSGIFCFLYSYGVHFPLLENRKKS